MKSILQRIQLKPLDCFALLVCGDDSFSNTSTLNWDLEHLSNASKRIDVALDIPSIAAAISVKPNHLLFI